MIARRNSSLIALLGTLACAALGAGCVVASEGSSTEPATQKQWELTHAPSPTPGLGGQPVQPTTVDDRNHEATLEPLAKQPGHDVAPSAALPGDGVELGFSVGTSGGGVGDDPRPHPWDPNPQPNAPTDKPKIGGYDQSSGPVPHK